MEEEQEEKKESYHSLHSQDTELIEEADSSHDVSSFSESANSSLRVNTGSPRVHSLIDFSPSPNASNTTACSTPHESRVSLAKRIFPSSSDDMIAKRQKMAPISTSSSSDSRFEMDVASSSSSRVLESESSQEVLEVSSTTSSLKLRNDASSFKRPDVRYAEASSSTSSAETLSMDFIRSFPDDTNFLKARLVQMMHDNNKLRNENRNLRSIPVRKKKREMNISNGEHKGKCINDQVLCDISYYYDETENEVTGIAIKQIYRPELVSNIRHPRLSLSSGSLADCSGSESMVLRGQSIASGSSSLSSVPSHAGKLIAQKSLPQVKVEVKKAGFLRYPKSCVCTCYCLSFIDHITRQSTRCLTPETSGSSSEIMKIDGEDLSPPVVQVEGLVTCERLKQEFEEQRNSITTLPNGNSIHVPDNNISNEATEAPNEHCVNFRSRSSIYIPASKNLPVFAKWPSNSFCYPGIVENATEETWHSTSHLNVKFCDGTIKKILSENLFPAYLLPSGTEICFEKDDICETAILISIERLLNNELVCLGELKGGIGEVVNIPFHKIFLSDNCYKGLKREMTSTITPKKTPRFSISAANVQEGKRNRKVVKRDIPEPKVTDSPARKPKPRGKRTRSTTDSTSSETFKESEKKKFRGSSQKKQQPKKNCDQATPNASAGSKKDVHRKLYVDSPGSSKVTKPTDSVVLSDIIFNSDSDASVQKDVNIDDVQGPCLDSELVPAISLRALKTKSSQRKNSTGAKDIKIKGPIPASDIFSGFNFVLSQSVPKSNSAIKPKKREHLMSSEEGSETDYEDYFTCPIPFDHIRLREQITNGGGRVYRSLLDIIPDDLKKTILITDNIVETPNYLLAVSMGIPIYRFDLIINCCIQGKRVSEMLGFEMKMPNGRSLETGRWVDRKASDKPLKGHRCLLSLSGNESTLNFWWYILNNAGATVIQNQTPLRLISDFGDQISFMVSDEYISEDLMARARSFGIPVVSTVWVIQSIIHGKARVYDSHPQYVINPAHSS